MEITIVGTGYVGLITGVCFAHAGHKVTCVDTDESRINLLKNGGVPIHEEGLKELLESSKGNLCFTTQPKEAYSKGGPIFMAVGTPEKLDGSANLSYVYSVVDEVARCAQKDCIFVVKSTVPIGTGDKIEERLRETSAYGVKFSVVSNPEFLSQGTAVRDTMEASRIVMGFAPGDTETEKTMREIYSSFNSPVVATSRPSAEMIKYASNDFLALKISYINEIANLCSRVGANVEEVAKGMGYDSRIGSKFLKAGIGYGGSCFPKDTKALHWLANFHDYEMKTIKAAIEVNSNQKLLLVKKAKKYAASFRGLTVAALGLTFKPETDDLREAPSLDNIAMVLEDGGTVRAWDPVGAENFSKKIQGDITYFDTPQEALKGADLCLIFTEWDTVMKLKPEDFTENMKHAVVLDGRNCYELDKMNVKGMIYESIGRPTVGS